MSSNIKNAFDSWKEGLISTSEILAKILISDCSVEDKLEHIATITIILNEQEQQDADEAFRDANWFNYSEHVRDYYIKDLPDEPADCGYQGCPCKDEI